MKPTTQLRRYCGAGKHDTAPFIQVIVGSYQSPKLTGDHPYFTTPSGKTIINYPNAYNWPKSYHPSTRRIEVGLEWLKVYGYSDQKLNQLLSSDQTEIIQ